MSHSKKPILGLDSLTDRLRNSLSCNDELEINSKPDHLGSPVSPLRVTRTATSTSSTSSSSSSGSVSGRYSGPKVPESNHSGELSGSVESSPTAPGLNPCRNEFNSGPKRCDSNHSGELSDSPTAGRVNPGRNVSYSGRKMCDSNHSGELSGSVGSSPTAGRLKSGNGLSDSGRLIYSGGCSITSPGVNVLPVGNICPSGKILKTGMGTSKSTKSDVLGSGTGNYGHGSIMRGGAVDLNSRTGETVKRRILNSGDPEELKRIGNEKYKKGNFMEALNLYDKAIAISPGNAALHCNRAATLMGLNRLEEAVRECEEAIRLDPSYVRAHQRLASVLLSLGQVENARSHFFSLGHKSNQAELQKLQAVEKHISKCTDARRAGNWMTTLREAEAATAFGADASPQLFACRAEAYLKLHKLEDAECYFSKVRKFESYAAACPSKFFGMLSEAYIFFVQAQIEMALGRFENSLTAVERAAQIDPRSNEVSVLLNSVRLVGRARSRGNDLFKSERYTEACAAYGEGLRHDSSNSVLYCNKAACWYKLGHWEKSLDDCNQALLIQPKYTKALLRRAASNAKLVMLDNRFTPMQWIIAGKMG